MEEVSIGLSKEYRKRFGAILHHNCDKGLLVAGRVERRFGGGCVIEPMKLVMGDRALWQADGKGIDVEAVAVAAARRWVRKHLRFVDPEKDLDYQVEMRPGSERPAFQSDRLCSGPTIRRRSGTHP
jgi:S-adenosylmethionine synthetase